MTKPINDDIAQRPTTNVQDPRDTGGKTYPGDPRGDGSAAKDEAGDDTDKSRVTRGAQE